KKLGAAEGLRQEAFEMAVLEIRNRNPADQMIRELVGRHFIQPGPERLRCPQADCIGRDPAIEDEAPSLLALQGLPEQLVELQNLDSALLHLHHEIVVVLLRLLHPDHIVEEKVLAIPRRQALMGEAWAADHDGPQLAYLGVDAKLMHSS